jgi:hypothetical protein
VKKKGQADQEVQVGQQIAKKASQNEVRPCWQNQEDPGPAEATGRRYSERADEGHRLPFAFSTRLSLG